MTSKPLLEQLEAITDPRLQAKCTHILSETVFMTIVAMLCGFDTWAQIHLFSTSRKSWFKELGLSLPGGIPSEDTFNRVFAILPPNELKGIFQDWLQDIVVNEKITGQLAIDGKALRATAKGRGKNSVHMVNAWSTELGICIGQQKVDVKSNEITAIPKLLETLAIEGCLVSIDAMGTQIKIASTIIKKGADYILPTKDNQPTLNEEVESHFVTLWETTTEDHIGHDFHEQFDNTHGRKERRRCWVIPVTNEMPICSDWKAKTLIAVQSERSCKGKSHDFTRFYISSRELDATAALNASRAHWEVENLLHWRLDVAFSEDQIKARAGYAGENLAVIRQWLLNMFSQNKTRKISMENKRKLCSINDEYLFDCMDRLKSTL